jgi:aryl-alcohol dehydrogenase-like predicted oxidoreductase
MRKRKIGNPGLEVSPPAFGGNVFGWTVDEPMSFKLSDAFVASGCNFIDTVSALVKTGSCPYLFFRRPY